MDHNGDEITVLDEIPVLLPDESVSTLVGASHDIVKKYTGIRFEGEAHFEDANGRLFCQKFVCSTQEHRKRLIHDEELPKTLRDLQDVPKQLGQIVDALNELRINQENSRRSDPEVETDPQTKGGNQSGT